MATATLNEGAITAFTTSDTRTAAPVAPRALLADTVRVSPDASTGEPLTVPAGAPYTDAGNIPAGLPRSTDRLAVLTSDEIELIAICRHLASTGQRQGGEVELFAHEALRRDGDAAAIADYETLRAFGSFVQEYRSGASMTEICRILELTKSEGERFRRAWQTIAAVEQQANDRARALPKEPAKEY